MDNDKAKIQRWILTCHANQPPARVLDVNASDKAIGHEGVWWAVVDVEAPEANEPDSVWPDQDKAEARAAELNKDRYPSWHAMPAVARLWMRNEFYE